MLRNRRLPASGPCRRPLSNLALALACAALPALCAGAPLAAQAPPTELTVEKIMAQDWIGTFPDKAYWSDDGHSIYYEKARPASDLVDLHRIDIASGKDSVVS